MSTKKVSMPRKLYVFTSKKVKAVKALAASGTNDPTVTTIITVSRASTCC